jgi:serine O-acetyltransferase
MGETAEGSFLAGRPGSGRQINMFENIRADFKRQTEINTGVGKARMVFYILFSQGFWAAAAYRVGWWCNNTKIPVLSFFLNLGYFFLNKNIEILTGISISSSAKIGKGLLINHFGQIFMHNLVEIGENCTIAQGVTIGSLGLGKLGAPKLGNNVFIGSGAKVLGNIRIGNNVRIGSNAVVLIDVPDNATVVGIPAKIIKINGK